MVRILGYYAIQEDVEELRNRISKAHQEVSRLDETFFASRFEKPLGTMSKAKRRKGGCIKDTRRARLR